MRGLLLPVFSGVNRMGMIERFPINILRVAR
jgi:hypothetical protein